MAAVTICSDFEAPQNNVSHCFHCFPIYFPWVMGPDAMILVSSPITWWQINREKMEAVTDFIFLGSKTTADLEWSHEIKRHLLLRRNTKTNLDSILKEQRDQFPNILVKAMISFQYIYGCVCLSFMYGCESWPLKKAKPQGIDGFKLWCCWRVSRIPWTLRSSNQS